MNVYTNFITNLTQKRLRLEWFAKSLFRCGDDRNVNVRNCPFADEGPHRYVRLSMGATTIILTLIEHGFIVVHDEKLASINNENHRNDDSDVILGGNYNHDQNDQTNRRNNDDTDDNITNDSYDDADDNNVRIINAINDALDRDVDIVSYYVDENNDINNDNRNNSNRNDNDHSNTTGNNDNNDNTDNEVENNSTRHEMNRRQDRRIDGNRSSLRKFTRSIVCEFCGTKLCDANTLLLILGQRNEIIGQILQSENAKRITGGPLPLVNFMQHSNYLYSMLRENIDRRLYETHTDDCLYREIIYYPDMIDPLTANRIINCSLRDRCETCLFWLVENEVYLEMALEKFENVRMNVNELSIESMNTVSPTRTISQSTSSSSSFSLSSSSSKSIEKKQSNIDATCRCCFEGRAQINVPCGHLFQCKNCGIQMKRAMLNGDQTIMLCNPPCSVCRAPVLMSLNIYD